MKRLLLLSVFLSFLAFAQAQQNSGEFPIGDIKFRYGESHPELPGLAELDELRVSLNRSGNNLGFDAAKTFARSLGCRLLTVNEWARLIENDQHVSASYNIKDKSWSELITYITNNSHMQIGELIGDLFLPKNVDIDQYYANEINPVTQETDGSVWFRETQQDSREFLNLRGNVSEYVTGEDGKMRITGGSALSPADVDPSNFYSIDDVFGEVAISGYSDVGFRMCFDAPILTYGERFADFVYNIDVSN